MLKRTSVVPSFWASTTTGGIVGIGVMVIVGVCVGGKVCVAVGVLVSVGVELTRASWVAVISASDRGGEQAAVKTSVNKRMIDFQEITMRHPVLDESAIGLLCQISL
jgi:hypothetical protein